MPSQDVCPLCCEDDDKSEVRGAKRDARDAAGSHFEPKHLEFSHVILVQWGKTRILRG